MPFLLLLFSRYLDLTEHQSVLVRYFGFMQQGILKSICRGRMFIILSDETIWDDFGKNIHQRFAE